MVAFAAQHVHGEANVAPAIPAAIAFGFRHGQRKEHRLRVRRFAAQHAERNVAQREQRHLEHAQQPRVPVRIDRNPKRRERVAGFGTSEEIDVAVERQRHVRIDERIFIGGKAARGAMDDGDTRRRRSGRDQTHDAVCDERDLGIVVRCAMRAHGAARVGL